MLWKVRREVHPFLSVLITLGGIRQVDVILTLSKACFLILRVLPGANLALIPRQVTLCRTGSLFLPLLLLT